MQKFNIVLFVFAAQFFSISILHASERGVICSASKVGGLAACIYLGYKGLGCLWDKAWNVDNAVPKKGKTQSKIVVSPKQNSQVSPKRGSTEMAFAFQKTNRDLSPIGLKEGQIKRKKSELQKLEQALEVAKKDSLDLSVKIAQAKDDVRQYEQDLIEIIKKIKAQEEEAKKDDEALVLESTCFPCMKRSSIVSPSSISSTLPSFCLTPRSMQSSTFSSISSSLTPSSLSSNYVSPSPLTSPMASSSSATPSPSSSMPYVLSSTCYSFQTKQ